MIHELDILLVEDNPRDAELTMRTLRRRTVLNQIHWVRDGAEALEFMFDQPPVSKQSSITYGPKLILLDLKLPKVDGLELLRQLKSNPLTKSIPVVILTSSREEKDQVRSYELGANSYIVKPVDYDSFSDAVAQLGTYWLTLNEHPSKVQ